MNEFNLFLPTEDLFSQYLNNDHDNNEMYLTFTKEQNIGTNV